MHFRRCCPLPLAADDADFMTNVFLGFGSGSIEFSLNSRDVDAANFGAGAASVTLLLLSFLCSPLCITSANASLNTSLVRSNLSAPCGVLLRHSSIRTLQQSKWACALFDVFDSVATRASNSDSELVDVLLGDSLPLDSCSFTWQWRDWNWVHSNIWSVHCPSAVCFVPSALRFQYSDFTGSTPSAFFMKHHALLLRIPSQIPNLHLRFILFMGSVELCFANTFSANGTHAV